MIDVQTGVGRQTGVDERVQEIVAVSSFRLGLDILGLVHTGLLVDHLASWHLARPCQHPACRYLHRLPQSVHVVGQTSQEHRALPAEAV